MAEAIRWQQRFSNDCKALAQLETFIHPHTFELAWNTLRDLLRSQGNTALLGSRDTLCEAFRLGLVEAATAITVLRLTR